MKRLIAFLFLSFSTISVADATNLTVTLTSNFSGKIYHSDGVTPFAGAYVAIDWSRDGDSIGNISLGSAAVSPNPGTYAGSSIKTFVKTQVSSTVSIPVLYSYRVISPSGSVVAQDRRTVNIEISGIDTFQTNVQRSHSINLNNINFITSTNANVPGGGQNGPYIPDPTGVTGLVHDADSNRLVWATPASIDYPPIDHWIVVTKSSEPDKLCQSGFRLGGNFGNGRALGPQKTGWGNHFFTFVPEDINETYRIKICPIWDGIKFDPGTCLTTTGVTQVCEQKIDGIVYSPSKKLADLPSFQSENSIASDTNYFPNYASTHNWPIVPPLSAGANLNETWHWISGSWAYYVPADKKLYKQTVPNAIRRDIDPVLLADSEFSDVIANYPAFLRMNPSSGEFATAAEEREMLRYDSEADLSKPVSFFPNWSQVYNEKWGLAETKTIAESGTVAARNTKYVYILPSGALYRWDGGSSGASLRGQLLFKFSPAFYDNFEVAIELWEKFIQRGLGFATTSANFSYDTSYTFDSGAVHAAHNDHQRTHFYEKWFRSTKDGNVWYYILPSGEMYKWRGVYPVVPVPTAINPTIKDVFLMSIGYEIYSDPSRLTSLDY